MMKAGSVSAGAFRYWAKTAPADAPQSFHLLAFHSLDVAACGMELLRANPTLEQRLCRMAGLEPELLRRWVGFLLAGHDLGKVSDAFQGLRLDLMEHLQGRRQHVLCHERHDTLGHLLWQQVIAPGISSLSMSPGFFGARVVEPRLDAWLGAVAGHHGRPPHYGPERRLEELFPLEVQKDALAFVRELLGLFFSGAPPLSSLADPERLRRASWLVAGLAVAADWIGSSARWFPHQEEPVPLADYWRAVAQPNAALAVPASGLRELPSAPAGGLRWLWPLYDQATPLQKLAEDLPLGPGPHLVVVEEVTGGGKTEAALVLAHRLMSCGEATGLYVGLPTMATANAMYRRIGQVYRRLFAPTVDPTLVLAHSRSHLMLPLDSTEPAPAPPGDEPSDAGDRRAWLLDSRKKALLAHVGVGTLDQALVGVLPLRHQSLRIAGLAGKVLIADEVHSYDAYTHGLLCTLLEFHAAFGGSAILLSATLPQRFRLELARAFHRGAGWARTLELSSVSYPLLTHLSRGLPQERRVAARPSAARRVEVRLLHDPQAIDAFLMEDLDRGGCACWVRNTVADAVAAYREWSARRPPGTVHLLHSRFTVADRADRENEVLDRFGPRSTPEDRCGHLLVATQVVEQSLDLDFDRMVSDLAPADLLIQRFGRLHRHARRADGARHSAEDERGPATLAVFAPPVLADPPHGWYADFLPGASLVYPDHGRLWLTAHWLAERGAVRMPEDARDLVERVYGDAGREAIPAGLRERTRKAESRSGEDAALSQLNGLSLAEGYQADDTLWADDRVTPTRLGQPDRHASPPPVDERRRRALARGACPSVAHVRGLGPAILGGR